MSNSSEVMHAGFAQHAIPTQFTACGIVPGKGVHAPLQFSAVFRRLWNPLKPKASAIVELDDGLKCSSSIRLPPASPEKFMTITAAHIQPIVALIAGVLILIMPRFLNFVVAIYLIFIGLAGLGLFKMLKF
jgi:hypothetical protein